MADDVDTSATLVDHVDYPMPPTISPKDSKSTLNADLALTALETMRERGVSATAAFRMQGVRYSRAHWERRASEGEPFYSWLITCMEMIEATSEAEVEAALYRKARFGSKDGMGDPKALDVWLKRRSQTFRDLDDGRGRGNTIVNITVGEITNMVEGNDGALANLTDAAYTVIDAEQEPKQIEADVAPRRMAFSRREPVVEED